MDKDCSQCKESFSTLEDLSDHERTIHQDIGHNEVPVSQAQKLTEDHISINHQSTILKTKTTIVRSLEFKDRKEKSGDDSNTKYTTAYFSEKSQESEESEKYVCRCNGPHLRSHANTNSKCCKNVKTGFSCPAFMEFKKPMCGDSDEVSCSSAHLDQTGEVQKTKIQSKISNVPRVPPINTFHLRSRVAGRLFLKCPKCFDVISSRVGFIRHLAIFHPEIRLKESHFRFRSSNKFLEWKSALDERPNSEYTLQLSYPKYLYNFQRFDCNAGLTSNCHCPASISVKFYLCEQRIDVSHVTTHLGHKVEDKQVDQLMPLQNDQFIKKCSPTQNNCDTSQTVCDASDAVQEDEDVWCVLPLSNETTACKIRRLKICSSHACEFKCSSCDICPHQFECDCSGVVNDVCIHIRKVCQKSCNCVHVEMKCCIKEEVIEPDDTASLENDTDVTLAHLREQAKSSLLELLEKIDACNNEEMLEEFITKLTVLKNVLNSLPRVSLKRLNFDSLS